MTQVINAWHVETDPFRKRRLGKALEELSELSNVLARCIIQGVDEIDPSSGEVNRLRMQKEVADVYTQLGCLVVAFELDTNFIFDRMNDKLASMDRWEELLEEENLLAAESHMSDKGYREYSATEIPVNVERMEYEATVYDPHDHSEYFFVADTKYGGSD